MSKPANMIGWRLRDLQVLGAWVLVDSDAQIWLEDRQDWDGGGGGRGVVVSVRIGQQRCSPPTELLRPPGEAVVGAWIYVDGKSRDGALQHAERHRLGEGEGKKEQVGLEGVKQMCWCEPIRWLQAAGDPWKICSKWIQNQSIISRTIMQTTGLRNCTGGNKHTNTQAARARQILFPL